MSRISIITLFILMGVQFSISSQAAEDIKRYEIENTEVKPLKSSSNGKEYELYIQLPSSYHTSASSYPVIFLNDTPFSFPIASGVVRLLGGNDIGEVILVGISYSKGDKVGISRTRDYTPTFAPDETSYYSLESKKVSGQSDNYIEFISGQVLPYVKAHYRADFSNKIFVGHSFSGLLGVSILLKHPELFDHYIIGSPSLWYDNRVVFSLEEAYSKNHKYMKANVYMYVGDSEDTEDHKMIYDIISFEKVLKSRNYSGLNVKSEVLKNATHHSAFSILFQKALLEIL